MAKDAVKICVAGAGGRMGCRIVALAAESGAFRVTGAFEVKNHPAIGRDAGIVAGCGELNVKVTSDAEKAVKGADVVIDFTAPSAVPGYLDTAIAAGTGVVIGSTALPAEIQESLAAASKKISVIVAPNMSVGVNLLFKYAPVIAKALGAAYDIEIIESHHNKKKDAPSGTAARLLEEILKVRPSSKEDVVYGRKGLTGERRPSEIGMHVIRAGDITGEHTIYFATEGERIEITHRASSRDTFARGALRAAAYLAGRKPGEYSMEDVLFGE